MKGLIKKDLFCVKSNLKLLVFLMIVFSIMAFYGEPSIVYMPVFLSVIIMFSCFSYDEFNKFDAYVCTLPNGKKNAVKARYLTTIILAVIGTFIAYIVSLLIEARTGGVPFLEILMYSLGSMAGGLLVIAIFYPVIYKFGIEKSRILMFTAAMLILIVPNVLGLFNISLPDINIPSNILKFFDSYAHIIVFLLTIILLFGSYKLSSFIYKRKEF